MVSLYDNLDRSDTLLLVEEVEFSRYELTK
jgi:hypothetical protein